jgi:hypothetical protein
MVRCPLSINLWKMKTQRSPTWKRSLFLPWTQRQTYYPISQGHRRNRQPRSLEMLILRLHPVQMPSRRQAQPTEIPSLSQK